MTQTEASIDDLVAEIRAGLDGVTDGPWDVIEDRHPWMLPAEPQRGRLADKNGEHIERRIFTTWQDAQLKSGIPVVNLSVGLGAEPRQPIHMVHMESADAAHIARMSPDNITRILDALEASEAKATRLRDEPAEQITDAVLGWMVERGFLDADNEYGPQDVLAVLNDLVAEDH